MQAKFPNVTQLRNGSSHSSIPGTAAPVALGFAGRHWPFDTAPRVENLTRGFIQTTITDPSYRIPSPKSLKDCSMKTLATIALSFLFATAAAAHSPVRSTMPENASVVAEVPAQVSIEFANTIRLTRVDMTYQDQPSVELDLGDQTSFATEFSLSLEGSGAGTYLIAWRGLGADGHPMSGDFSFSVD